MFSSSFQWFLHDFVQFTKFWNFLKNRVFWQFFEKISKTARVRTGLFGIFEISIKFCAFWYIKSANMLLSFWTYVIVVCICNKGPPQKFKSTDFLLTDFAHFLTRSLYWSILLVYQVWSQSVNVEERYRQTDRHNGQISPRSGKFFWKRPNSASFRLSEHKYDH